MSDSSTPTVSPAEHARLQGALEAPFDRQWRRTQKFHGAEKPPTKTEEPPAVPAWEESRRRRTHAARAAGLLPPGEELPYDPERDGPKSEAIEGNGGWTLLPGDTRVGTEENPLTDAEALAQLKQRLADRLGISIDGTKPDPSGPRDLLPSGVHWHRVQYMGVAGASLVVNGAHADLTLKLSTFDAQKADHFDRREELLAEPIREVIRREVTDHPARRRLLTVQAELTALQARNASERAGLEAELSALTQTREQTVADAKPGMAAALLDADEKIDAAKAKLSRLDKVRDELEGMAEQAERRLKIVVVELAREHATAICSRVFAHRDQIWQAFTMWADPLLTAVAMIERTLTGMSEDDVIRHAEKMLSELMRPDPEPTPPPPVPEPSAETTPPPFEVA